MMMLTFVPSAVFCNTSFGKVWQTIKKPDEAKDKRLSREH